MSNFNKISNNSPDEPAAVTGEVAVAETVVAVASTTSVAGHFGPATREAKRADSPTPATTSSVPDRREVVGAVVEEFGTAAAAVVAAADDQPAVAGSGSCHKVPAEKTVTAINTQFILNHTCAHIIIIIVPNGSNSNSISIASIGSRNNNSSNFYS